MFPYLKGAERSKHSAACSDVSVHTSGRGHTKCTLKQIGSKQTLWERKNNKGKTFEKEIWTVYGLSSEVRGPKLDVKFI